MRSFASRLILALVSVVAASSLQAQQAPEAFHWVDFHAQQDQSVVTWVTRALAVEDWSAIREIGVEYDAALVVTTKRATPQTPATHDSFTVWNVSLVDHSIFPLLKGADPRWLDWMRFADGAPEELALTYNNCAECNPTTYFTALRYDVRSHAWAARWIQSGQGAPLWTESHPAGVEWTQVYAGVSEPNGRALLSTWSHFEYGKDKDPSDSIYRYDVDQRSGLERTLPLVGKDADAVKLRICKGQDAIPGLLRGQDSDLCLKLTGGRPDRRISTTPPAHNRGRMGARSF